MTINDNVVDESMNGRPVDLLRSRLRFELAGGQRLVHQEDGIPGAVSISGDQKA